MDKSTQDKIALLHPSIRNEVADTIFNIGQKGVIIRIPQGFRSFEEQDALYAKGRTLPGPIVTNAKGGQSYHNYGLAIDFCLLHKDGTISWDMKEDMNEDHINDWQEVIDAFGLKGFNSGMYWKFKDNPHLEKTFGYSFIQLLQKYNAGKVDEHKYVIL